MDEGLIDAMLAVYAEEGAQAAVERFGLKRNYVYQLAHKHGVASPVTRARQAAQAQGAAPEQGEPARGGEKAAGAKRAVLVCPGCVWAGGVPQRRICPRVACEKVRLVMAPRGADVLEGSASC